MDIETIEEEILQNGNRKINIGIRAYPELKHKLKEEASALGITLSEHSENLLLSVDVLKSENSNKQREIEALTLQIKSLQKEISDLKGETKLAVVEKEEVVAQNDELNQKIAHFKHLLSIYNEPRLLKLFEELKGKEDPVTTHEGEIYLFKYNQPRDVLESMLYSFKLKKL